MEGGCKVGGVHSIIPDPYTSCWVLRGRFHRRGAPGPPKSSILLLSAGEAVKRQLFFRHQPSQEHPSPVVWGDLAEPQPPAKRRRKQ